MKLLALMLVGILAIGAHADASTNSARQLQTIGPDDVAAASAVGEAAMMGGLAVKKAGADIARAKAKEARVNYLADKKVARAVEHAIKHSGAHAAETAALANAAAIPGVGGVAAAGALLSGLETAKISAHDGKRIARAVAKAEHMKAKAKVRTMKVVAKSVGEAAATGLAYGGKAALAVGNAALHDAATFLPIMGGLAPQFLPQLAGNLASLGANGLTGVLSNLAQAIGGALLGGNSPIGVAGPDLLANRIANLLPDNLLQGLPLPGLANEGPVAGPEAFIPNVPAEALELIVNFLSGGQLSPSGGNGNLPALPRGPDANILVPGNALQAILRSVTGLMNRGRGNGQGPLPPFQLPRLPPGGLPMPLRMLGNLLGVLPRPDLSGILNLLPRLPLANLVGGLPLGLLGADE